MFYIPGIERRRNLLLSVKPMQKQKRLKQKVVNGFKHLIKPMCMFDILLSFLKKDNFLVTKNGLINPKLLTKNYPIVVEINPMIMHKVMKFPVLNLNHVCFILIKSLLLFISLGQFQQRVKQLMNREKTQLKSKGRQMPKHSELKNPDQIVKKRTEKSKKQSLQRARQARKGGRTNYKNKRHSSTPKHTRRGASNTKNNPTKRTKK